MNSGLSRTRTVVLVLVCVMGLSSIGMSTENAADVTVTADFSSSVGTLNRFWNSGGWDNEQVTNDANVPFDDIDPKNTKCIYQNEQIIGTIPGGFYDRFTMPMSNYTVFNLDSGNPTYDFSELDQFLDVVVRSRVTPWFELWGMPKGSEKIITDFRNDKDVRLWKRLVTDLVLHLESRYGKNEIRRWWFEGYNEPPRYIWIFDTYQEYFNYHDACSEGLLAVDPELKFGGPSTIGYEDWLHALITHCATGKNYFTGETGVRLDYISFHYKSLPHAQVTYAIDRVIGWVRENHPSFLNKPFINLEADEAESWRTPYEYRATPWYSSQIARQVTESQLRINLGEQVTYMLSNDNNFFGTHWGNRAHTMQFGGNKLETYSASELAHVADNFALIKKPMHNIFTALYLLGSTQCKFSPGYADQVGGMATRQGDSQVAVLVYNYTDQKTDTIYPSDCKKVQLNLTNIPFASGKMVEYRIDKDHGNTYKQWLGMGSPAIPSDAQIQQLRKGQELGIVGGVKDLASSNTSLTFDLPRCGVSLFLISADPGAPPGQVTGLHATRYRALSNKQDDVMVKWSDLGSKFIKTYEVCQSATPDGTYRRVNTADILCTGFVCPVPLGSDAYFKVRAVDYWDRAGAFSDVASIGETQPVAPATAPGAGGKGSPKTALSAILMDRFGKLDLAALVAPLAAYHPFPTADERAAWTGLPAGQRAAIIASAEPLLQHSWPQLPATLYMDFARTGNRRRYEQPYFARRSALGRLVLAECVEGSGRFLDDIINGIWAICEESTWVISGHNPGPGKLPDVSVDPNAGRHYVEMSTHMTGAQLAWVHYLLRSQLDSVDPLVSARIRREVKARVLDPFLADIDYDAMRADKTMLLNNHAPWSCRDCLSCFLVLEAAPERRAEAVRKVMHILDLFVARYPADGGCDEGPGYWSVAAGALFDTLELLRSASKSRISVYDEPLIQEMGRYIFRAHISGDYFVNFADASPKDPPEAGHVYRFGRRIGDERMIAFGRFLYRKQKLPSAGETELVRALPNMFGLDKGISAPGAAPLRRDVWLPGLQVMAARQREGSDAGFYLAAKGGHNAESHNHNDVGQFLVYLDGKPVLVDAGTGAYTRQTFSAGRYKLWTHQSAYHNLPTVNGVMQKEGAEFRAADVFYHADGQAAEFSLNIAGAYPRASGIQSWRRTCRLARGTAGSVEIVDDFVLNEPSQDIALSLLTPLRPEVSTPGVIGLGHASLLFKPNVLTVAVEPIDLKDRNLRRSWGQNLYRLVLRPVSPVEKGDWVLRLVRRQTGMEKR